MRLALDRGDAIDAPDPAADGPLIGLLATPGLVLHHLQLAASGRRARLEEARLRAIDLAGQPIDDLFLALGDEERDGSSWLALASRSELANSLARFRAAGLEPERLFPAALLLADGPGPQLARLGPRLLLRTGSLAGVVEDELAPLLSGQPLPPAAAIRPFTPRLPEDPADWPPDLLQGEFAPRRRWWRERRFQLQAAALASLSLLLIALPPAASHWRLAAAIRGYDSDTLAAAATVLPGTPKDAEAAATALAEARQKETLALVAPRLAFAAKTIAAAPGSSLRTVSFADGRLALSLGGTAEAINEARRQLAAGPWGSENDGATILLAGRQAPAARGRTALSAAMLRLAAARNDAAALATTPTQSAPGQSAPPIDELQQQLQQAGLTVTREENELQIAAARAPVLLPLLAELEQEGARFERVALAANDDETIRATLGIRP